MPPGAYQPPYATTDPNVLFPAQTPGGYSPWPEISPYGLGNYASDEHYRKGGVWFREIMNKKRDYEFSVDALYLIGSGPGHATVGARTQTLDNVTDGLEGFEVPTYGVGLIGDPAVTGPSTEPGGRVFIDTGVIPYVFLFEAGDASPIAFVDNNLFPIWNFSMFSEYRLPGLQVNWGYEDESGGGLRASGWWGFEDGQTFQRGQDVINGVTLTQAIIINQAGRMLFSKNGAIPWETGIPTPIVQLPLPGNDGGTVGTQKYDVMFRLSTTQEMGGGDIQYILPDLTHDRSGLRLRPLYSAKYLYLHEGFEFRGVDSGLSYTVSGGEGADDDTPTFRPIGPPFTINNELFEAQLQTTTRSHLAGPTVGIRYDLGNSRDFRVWGNTSFGLMGNYEEVRVNGFNAGETVVTEFLTGTNMLDGDSRFEDVERHAHVSPLFETSINAESRVLGSLPLIQEVPFLSAANLKIGVTHTIVGHMARPANSTEWLGFPQFPRVDINYKNWYVTKLNLGLEWTY